VYALGAILYEMLTGRPPFLAETPVDTILQVVADPPVSPSRLQSKVPAELEAVCLKCLEKEPRRRYASAEGLAEDLECFLAGAPPGAGRHRALSWLGRNGWRLAAVGFWGLSLLALVALSIVGGDKVPIMIILLVAAAVLRGGLALWRRAAVK